MSDIDWDGREAAARGECDACGESGIIQYNTEGDGVFWLCGSLDDDHSTDKYSGWIVGTVATKVATERDAARAEAEGLRALLAEFEAFIDGLIYHYEETSDHQLTDVWRRVKHVLSKEPTRG